MKVKIGRPNLQASAQLGGALCVVAAVALLAGPAWGLLLVGVLLVAVGVLAEAGWI